jgi:hypothetical protein
MVPAIFDVSYREFIVAPIQEAKAFLAAASCVSVFCGDHARHGRQSC